MASKEIQNYYQETRERPIREDLKYAVSLVSDPKVAIDCGCGAGADIAFLLRMNFKVYAFDCEQESIKICRQRFQGNKNVFLSQSNFDNYHYPSSALVVADSSLFFCPPRSFVKVWRSITESIMTEGIFCGSFLGPGDTMATPNYINSGYWAGTLTFTKAELESIFKKYRILRFQEHTSEGMAPNGKPHTWHIFSIVAKKINHPHP